MLSSILLSHKLISVCILSCEQHIHCHGCLFIASETPISINQDANIYVTEIDEGNEVPFEVKDGRQVYVICVEGSVSMLENGTQRLDRHDAAEVLFSTL